MLAYIWQFEQTGPNKGTWNRTSVRHDKGFYCNYKKQSNRYIPRLVSADSEGIARIIPGTLLGRQTYDGFIVLRFEYKSLIIIRVFSVSP